MKLNGGVMLSNSLKRVLLAWAETEDLWKDSVRENFQDKYLSLIETQIRSTVEEINALAEVFKAAERECR